MGKLKIKYPEIGVCGLSCRLCSAYHVNGKSRCPGCKTKFRMFGPCTMLHCKTRREQGVEFCWDCSQAKSCPKWKKHRALGKNHDSFKYYQTLEKDIAFIQKNGIKDFRKDQKEREKLLLELLKNFDEGRSKRFYCIVVTVMEQEEIKKAIAVGKKNGKGLNIKKKAKLMHSIFEEIASKKKYLLKLRKWK